MKIRSNLPRSAVRPISCDAAEVLEAVEGARIAPARDMAAGAEDEQAEMHPARHAEHRDQHVGEAFRVGATHDAGIGVAVRPSARRGGADGRSRQPRVVSPPTSTSTTTSSLSRIRLSSRRAWRR